MKSLVRNIAIYSLSLYLLALFLDGGVRVTEGLLSYVLAGIILYMMFLLLKPIFNIISLPLNIITLGAFSFVINALILYLLTVFLPNVSIQAFRYKGLSVAGFIVPGFYVNTSFSFIFASLVLSVIISFLTWIIKK